MSMDDEDDDVFYLDEGYLPEMTNEEIAEWSKPRTVAHDELAQPHFVVESLSIIMRHALKDHGRYLARWPEACRRAGFEVFPIPADLVQLITRAFGDRRTQ